MAEPIITMRPQGRLDGNTSRDFERALLKRIEDGERLLVLDFSDVAFISSAGLRAVLLAARQIKIAGGRLAICSPARNVKEILDITNCTTLVGVFPTYESAAAHLSMT